MDSNVLLDHILKLSRRALVHLRATGPGPAAPRLPRIPKRLIARLLKNPIVVVSAASLGVKIGKDAYDMKLGEIDAKEFRLRTGSHLGALSGGVFGAAAGAAALSVVPGVGTALGAFAGGMVGEHLGAKLGRRSAEHAEVYFYGAAAAVAADEAVGATTKKRTL